MNKFFQFNEFVELGKIFSCCEAHLIALEYFDKAIALSYLPINKDRLVEAYDQRGDTKMFLRKNVEAIVDYSKAIELEANKSSLYFSRGMSYEYLELREEALKNLKMSVQLDPDNSFAIDMIDYLENK